MRTPSQRSACAWMVFRWLSIFVGGCTLEAAEVVCQQDSTQTFHVLDGIASLLDKSLLQQTAHEGAEPRLVMLETIREFGLEQLHQLGELEAAHRAHARYYLQLVETAEPHLLGPDQLLWFARLEQDLDNLRAILQAGMSGGAEEVELALRLAGALRLFWNVQGYLREGRDVLERLLADTTIPQHRHAWRRRLPRPVLSGISIPSSLRS